VGQQPQQVQGQTLFGGNLTVVNSATTPVVPSERIAQPGSSATERPGAVSRMLLADDNTLWIGMTKCTNGVRAATGQPYGCLTMVNTTNNTVTLLEPYIGDATGIAAVTGLHKIYTARAGRCISTRP
jgi:glucose dehydrogenase